MNKLRASFLLPILCLVLAAFSGCKEEDDTSYKVPRLMVETRGVSYGGMIGESAVLPLSGTKISVDKEPVVTEFDIYNIELVKVDLGLAIMLEVSERGERSLYRTSVTHKGARVVLMINGNAIGASRIDETRPRGRFYTFVELPDDELGQFVLDVKESIAKIQAAK